MSTQTLQKGDAVSVIDAAKLIGVHYVSVYRWIEAGKIAFIKFGGSLFVPYTEVERMKDKRMK